MKILVIGSGYMANEYLKVLKYLNHDAIIVGRRRENIEKLKLLYPEFQYFYGGVDHYFNTNTDYPKIAINTVNVECLMDTTISILNAGIKQVLIEKPGALTYNCISKLRNLTEINSAKVFIAYNRRFYPSVNELQKQTELDGGILSVHFEFTEWLHTIDVNNYNIKTLNNWIVANSSHVIDTVFFLIGFPKTLDCKVYGNELIPWHPSGSIFIGSGVSEKNIPFSYHSNWIAPGRWSIEILTIKKRYYLRPMELLFSQNIGSVAIEPFFIEEDINDNFKKGIREQTEAFINGVYNNLCSISEQQEMLKFVYKNIGGY